MPRRNDLHRILVIGSGPIVIGQGAEFDYSGTQAAKALQEEGFEVILVNSNPATIMTDPEFADRTYIEPVTPEYVELVIAKERPDALLPTMGGQTALNVAMELYESGVLEKHGVALIGADSRAIRMAEDRGEFAEAMRRIGLAVPIGGIATTFDEALGLIDLVGFPAIIRPAFTLGGTGGGIAYNRQEFEDIVRRGLDLSPVSQVLIERSVIGWKEFELEVMRDCADNVVIVCSIENIDPMGVHTGDSITVAPAMTLTDREYQMMRDAAVAVIREIGVEAGGCNIQFAVNPENGEMLVIEMNPRVSRSSALASKATGFPIARIGTKLAVGYRLDEIPNDITKTTPASFEPVLDYVVVKCPRFAFEKFRAANPRLTTQMKSVGESMAIGRTFKEAFQKALRALEIGRPGLGNGPARSPMTVLPDDSLESLRGALRQPTPERIFQIKRALEAGMSIDELNELTRIDPWFLAQMQELVEAEAEYAELDEPGADDVRAMKRMGFSDRQLASLRGSDEEAVREWRWKLGVRPAYKMVDTCAGEFPVGDAVPLQQLRRRGRSSAHRQTQVGRDSRQRPQPHRPGSRVRLLLRARRARSARSRLRDDHDQLESGDGLDGFRHLRQALLRAADARGRARGGGPREAGRRDRSARRSDSAQAHSRTRGGRRDDSRHLARRDRHRRRSAALRCDRAPAGHQAAGKRDRDERRRRRWLSPRKSGIRCWCARRTCSVAGRWRSSTIRLR